MRTDRNEHEQFKARFLLFHPKLYRVAFALLGNVNDAEDVVQDAYLKLWEKRKELHSIETPEAYAVSLLKNLCLDKIRSAKVRSTVNLALEDSLLTTESATTYEHTEHLALAQKLIAQLPSKQQQALRLRAIDDCSLSEIEQIMGMSNVNIRQLISRARKTITTQLKTIFGNE